MLGTDAESVESLLNFFHRKCKQHQHGGEEEYRKTLHVDQ